MRWHPWVQRAHRPGTLLLVILALVLGAALGLPGATLGHAGFLGSSPADGEHLATPPARLTLSFSEAIGISADGVRLVDSAGHALGLPPAQAAGSRVIQDLPILGSGWYLATWSVVSEDGHVVHGAAAFAVGDVSGPPPVAVADPGEVAAGPVARAIANAGQLVATGALVAWLLYRGRGARVRRLGLGASLIGAAGAAALAVLVAGVGGAAVLGTAPFAGAAVRSAALALAAIAWRRRPALAVPPVVAALVAMLAGGHPGGDPLTATLLLVHLAGAGGWLSAAPAILMVLTDPSVPDAVADGVIRRFSRSAPIMLGAAVAGGTLLALDLTAGLASVTPIYLAALAGKVLAVGLGALLGALARRRLAGTRPNRHALLRVFTADVVLFLVVVGFSALLTVGAPIPSLASALHVGHCETEVNGRFVDVSLDPARVGETTVTIAGTPAAVRVSVQLRRPGDPAAIEAMVVGPAPSGSGLVAGPIAIPVQGTWEVTVVVMPDEFSQLTGACRLAVDP